MNILIYGDSNTWGYVPTLNAYTGSDATTKRYDEKDMWWYPLKEKNKLFVNGLNGRTCGYDHWIQVGKNASKTLDKDLENIDKIDLAIIMLGTNDFKYRYNPTINDVINNLDNLIKRIYKKYKCEFLIVCPPLIISGTLITKEQYINGEQYIKDYQLALKKYTKENNYLFASAIDCEVGVDGEHLTKQGHKLLSNFIYNSLK